jgi:hypothetical protein
MIDDNFEFRSPEIIRSSEKFEHSILKRTVLRKASSIVGVYYSMCLLKQGVCQMRTMEHGSLNGSVKSVKCVLERIHSRSVNVDVVCTVDDVNFLRQPHSGEVFPCRHDDVEKIQHEVQAIAKNIHCDQLCQCDAGFVFVVIDRGGGKLVVCENVFGDWNCSSLRDSIRSCFADAIGKSGTSKSFCLSNLVHNSPLEDWEVGNCLPNFDTNLSWVTYDHSKLMRERGKINVWRQYSFKAMFFRSWKIASIDDCISSVTKLQDSVNIMSRRTFKKRRSDHGKVGGDFGEFMCYIYIRYRLANTFLPMVLLISSLLAYNSMYEHYGRCLCQDNYE